MTEQAILNRIHASEWDREYIRYMEYQRDIDLLAARDTITLAEWRAEFAAWVEAQP